MVYKCYQQWIAVHLDADDANSIWLSPVATQSQTQVLPTFGKYMFGVAYLEKKHKHPWRKTWFFKIQEIEEKERETEIRKPSVWKLYQYLCRMLCAYE